MCRATSLSPTLSLRLPILMMMIKIPRRWDKRKKFKHSNKLFTFLCCLSLKMKCWCYYCICICIGIGCHIFLLPAGNLDWLLKCWQKWEIQFHKSGKSVSLKCEMDLNVSGQKMSAQVLKIEKGCFSKYLK